MAPAPAAKRSVTKATAGRSRAAAKVGAKARAAESGAKTKAAKTTTAKVGAKTKAAKTTTAKVGAGAKARAAESGAKTKAAKVGAKATRAKATGAKAGAKTKTAKVGATREAGAKAKKGAKATMETTKVVNAGGEVVHCYRLIFQVDPGGSRKAESFVAGTLAEVRRAALDDLGSGQGAYHALFYGEQIVLECWEGARRVAAIDLHPFITYQIAGEALTLPPGEEPPLSMEDEEALMMELVEETIAFEVEVDWPAIRLPTLAGRPLRPGESMALEGGRAWAHGFHEHWDMKIAI